MADVREVVDKKIKEFRNDESTPMWARAAIDAALLVEPEDAARILERLSELFTLRLGDLLTKAR